MPCHDCVGCPYASKSESARVVTALNGRLSINLSVPHVFFDGTQIKMFKSRVRILAALASGPPDDIITMDRMKLALWGADDEPEEAMNLMRVHMTAIRQALRLANVPLSIKSSYGVGWYLREERNETAIA